MGVAKTRTVVRRASTDGQARPPPTRIRLGSRHHEPCTTSVVCSYVHAGRPRVRGAGTVRRSAGAYRCHSLRLTSNFAILRDHGSRALAILYSKSLCERTAGAQTLSVTASGLEKKPCLVPRLPAAPPFEAMTALAVLGLRLSTSLARSRRGCQK